MKLHGLLDHDLGPLKELELGVGLLDELEEADVDDGSNGEEEHFWSEWLHSWPVGLVVWIVFLLVGLDGWVIVLLLLVVEVLPVVLVVHVVWCLLGILGINLLVEWLLWHGDLGLLLLPVSHHVEVGLVLEWCVGTLDLRMEELWSLDEWFNWLDDWRGDIVVDGAIEEIGSQESENIVEFFLLSSVVHEEGDEDQEDQEVSLESFHSGDRSFLLDGFKPGHAHEENEEADGGFEDVEHSDLVVEEHLDAIS